jgi:hypothetical protein
MWLLYGYTLENHNIIRCTINFSKSFEILFEVILFFASQDDGFGSNAEIKEL